MRILSPGENMTGRWVGKLTCTGKGNEGRGCGAALEVTEDDLYGTYSSHMGRFETYYITFMCPCCGSETDVSDTDGYHAAEFPARFRPQDFPKATTQQRSTARSLLRGGKYVCPRNVDH